MLPVIEHNKVMAMQQNSLQALPNTQLNSTLFIKHFKNNHGRPKVLHIKAGKKL